MPTLESCVLPAHTKCDLCPKPGHLLALHVTPANEQERDQTGVLSESVQEVTGGNVQLAYVDQGYTGDNAAEAAARHGLRLEVVKLAEAKKGFVLLPRRWVVERSFGWMARCHRWGVTMKDCPLPSLA